MARLTLQTKDVSQQKIKRVSVGDPGYIFSNDPNNFTLLTDNRHKDEKFSRIDKWTVNHYYLIGNEWLYERIFYPSTYAMEYFNKLDEDKSNKHLILTYKKLKEKGIGLYGKRPIPNILKPVKRLQLECKPGRMRLECKE